MILRSSSDLVPEKVQQAQENYFLSEILFPNKYSHGERGEGDQGLVGKEIFCLILDIVLINTFTREASRQKGLVQADMTHVTSSLTTVCAQESTGTVNKLSWGVEGLYSSIPIEYLSVRVLSELGPPHPLPPQTSVSPP
jgi:hypothetical protein